MVEKADKRDESTPYLFIVEIKEQGKITIPQPTRKMEGFEVGDCIKVNAWMYKKGNPTDETTP